MQGDCNTGLFGPRLDERLELMRDIAPSLCCCGASPGKWANHRTFRSEAAFELRLALQVFSSNLVPSWAGPFRVPKMWSC